MDEEDLDELKELKEIRKDMFKRYGSKHSFITTATDNLIHWTFMMGAMLFDEEMRKLLTTREGRYTLFNREGRTGMLEGAIFQQPLYAPTENGLERIDAPAGRYASYDFNRTRTFKKSNRQKDRGRLITFTLEEIMHNDPSTRTPTSVFNMLNCFHLLTMEAPSLEEVLEYGFAKETTYKEAYEHNNAFSRHKTSLKYFDLMDKPVYQITPKGNTLVFLIPDGGDTQESDDQLPEPAFQFL